MTYLIGLITERIIIRENIDFTSKVDTLYRFVLKSLEDKEQKPLATSAKTVKKARKKPKKGKETGE